jgi:curved DNA-binding protein CbpA
VYIVVVANRSLYAMLGIAPDGSRDDIRAAHCRLVKQIHPDVGGNAATFREVRTAYETLNNPKARGAYDADRQPPADTPQSDEPHRDNAGLPALRPLSPPLGSHPRPTESPTRRLASLAPRSS